MDWPVLDIAGEGWTTVRRLADRVQQPAEDRFPDWCSNWLMQSAGRDAAHKPGCATEGHNPHDCWAEVLLHLRNQRRPEIPLNFNRFVDLRQRSAVEGNVDDRAANRSYAAQPRIRLERRSKSRHRFQTRR